MLLSFSPQYENVVLRAITNNLFSILNFALLLCRSAHLLSRYRPRCPIIAVTRSPQVHSALWTKKNITFVLTPGAFVLPWKHGLDDDISLFSKVNSVRCLLLLSVLVNCDSVVRLVSPIWSIYYRLYFCFEELSCSKTGDQSGLHSL